MEVIPVLDLKGGVVVLAGGGERAAYRPVDTPLCRDPAPAAVMTALLGLHPFTTIYIADLDRITHAGSNDAAVGLLARRWPDIEFWLDGGFALAADVTPFECVGNVRPVVGSESLESVGHYEGLRSDRRLSNHVLSLDRKNGAELGPPGLIDRPDLWPRAVISMDLDHVGENRGPNRDRLRRLRRSRQDIDIAAAGGIRGIGDLRQIRDDGITHALVATALHRGALDAAALASLAGDKKNAP